MNEEIKEESVVKNDGVSEVSNELLSNMPEPSEFVIEKAQNEANEKANNPLTDSTGDIFNPKIHGVNKNGEPYLTKTGKFRKKTGTKDNTTGQPGSQLNTESPGIPVTSEAAAKISAELLVTVGMQIGGEEWRPMINEEMGLNEMENMTFAFEKYFDSRGIVDFPPGIALTIAIGSYALPRLRMPKTKTRVGLVIKWVKLKIAKLTGKK